MTMPGGMREIAGGLGYQREGGRAWLRKAAGDGTARYVLVQACNPSGTAKKDVALLTFAGDGTKSGQKFSGPDIDAFEMASFEQAVANGVPAPPPDREQLLRWTVLRLCGQIADLEDAAHYHAHPVHLPHTGLLVLRVSEPGTDADLLPDAWRDYFTGG